MPVEAPRAGGGARRRGGARRAPRRSARPPTAAGASSALGDGAFRVSGEPVERLIARHDLDNEEALAHVERRLHRMGVIRALEAAGFEPGDDVEIARRRVRARSRIACARPRWPATSSSSDRASSPRTPARCAPDVLARVCDQVAARHAAGDDVVVVTSRRDRARDPASWACRRARRAIEDLQAASAVGQGKLYRVYDELLRERGVTSAQVLLTFFDMSARTHYLNARQTLRRLLDWRVVPVINENDTTATDEISFGDNDFLAAQVAILIGADLLVLLTDIDGLYTADPRTDPAARLRRGGRRLRGARRRSRSATTTSPLGSGGMRSKVVAAEMATAAGIPA